LVLEGSRKNESCISASLYFVCSKAVKVSSVYSKAEIAAVGRGRARNRSY
jgi:hypothetical protein